jgi:hypothetical protein
MIPQQDARKALIERAKVTARVLRITADQETTHGEVSDPPLITWAELNELAALMRDGAEVIEALSASSGSEETPTVHRSGSLLYTLMHDGWRKGVEQFRNRLMVSVDRDKSVPYDEYEAVMRRLAIALAATSETSSGAIGGQLPWSDLCQHCGKLTFFTLTTEDVRKFAQAQSSPSRPEETPEGTK